MGPGAVGERRGDAAAGGLSAYPRPVAKNAHPQASIDWASAEVKGGDLEVALAGEPNAMWAKRVEAILERLERPGMGGAR